MEPAGGQAGLAIGWTLEDVTITHSDPTTLGRPSWNRLSPGELELLGEELDTIRQDVLDDRGARDAAYIRRLVKVQRMLELGSRAVLVNSGRRSSWLLGTAGLTVAKVLDNMEIGHNVLHGQWDWMRDPKIHSSTWEWDHVTPAAQWQRVHNDTHHKFTNIIGQDNDLGYGIMRVDEAQEWQPRYLAQPAWNFVTACIFEYGIAMFDLDLGDHLRDKRKMSPEKKAEVKVTLAKARKQLTKDFVALPGAVRPRLEVDARRQRDREPAAQPVVATR